MIQILHSLDNSVTESDSVVIELRSFLVISKQGIYTIERFIFRNGWTSDG